MKGLCMEWIVVSSIVSAIATLAIAIFTYLNFRKDKKFKQELKDLYQAIVIATILSGPTSYGEFEKAKNVFKEVYKGKTDIF
ncbi:MAG: hypothetical protein DRI36_00765 [Caldiserica bacterium]|nr:MAG: hypothetical protein DRI36_00765 [Caldisericota bacterium]